MSKFSPKILLEPKDIKPSFPNWIVKGVLNPAAIRLPNGKIMLYARIAETVKHKKGERVCPLVTAHMKVKETRIRKKDIRSVRGHMINMEHGECRLSTISHFRKVILDETGMEVESISEKPDFMGQHGDGEYGVEDARIVKIGKEYVMTYVTIQEKEGVCTSLATSKDLKKWKRKGIIFRQQNKDGVLFPEKIKGKYVALHRPEGTFDFSKASIWISHSPDMIHWGEEKSIIEPREKGWDSFKVGTGTQPIKTKKGWLLIYHGIEEVQSNKKVHNIYRAGAALLDLKDPSKVLAISPKNRPLFSPDKKQEKKGFINNVVFPSGAVMDKDKKHLLVYSGGADSVTTVRRIPLKDIFANMKKP